jgi:hypothetical protein
MPSEPYATRARKSIPAELVFVVIALMVMAGAYGTWLFAGPW